MEIEDKFLELIEKMGAVVEFNQRSVADRAEMKIAIDKLDLNVDGLRQAVNSLTQSIQSTNTQVSSMATEKCGQRLDKIEALLGFDTDPSRMTRLANAEATVARWQKYMGQGWSLALRVFVAVVGSGVVGGALVSFAKDHIRW